MQPIPIRTLGLTLGVLCALAPAAARANGRPPAINSVAIDPRDPSRLVIGATFGPLVSKTCGATWRWTCEQAVGYSGVWDPGFVFSGRSSTIFATTFSGVVATTDEGCTWNRLPALGEVFVDDLKRTVEKDPGGASVERLWAATSSASRRNCVYESRDDGQTFSASGLCSDTLFFKSIAVAPSNPSQLYVLGYDANMNTMRPTFHRATGRDPTGVLQFETIELPAAAWTLYDVSLVGVESSDPNRVFLRGRDATGSQVWVTEDGGTNWRRVTLPDVSQILAGLLVDDLVLLATNKGLLKSSDHGASFQAVMGAPRLHCLSMATHGEGAMRAVTLYGCANPFTEGAAAFLSTDLGSWKPLFKFENLFGPLECPAQTPTTDVCTPLYPGLSMQLFTEGATPVMGPRCGEGGMTSPPDARQMPEPPSGDGGTVVTRNDGGSTMSAPKGCAAGGGSGGVALLGVGAVAILLRRRGRSRN